MCGICGVLEFSPGRLPEEALHQAIGSMNAAMVHRGPDDDGSFVDGHCGLGMRRLSIIGVQNGRQPIFNEDRSVVLVMNGEIYNYRQLRSDLEKRDHVFSTDSDAEVIVHLYEEDEGKFVDPLRGMFAIALWDRARQRLVLVRDRPGKKPLYWAESQGRLIFGSEIKAIHASGLVKKEFDPSGLESYLCFGYVVGEGTLFREVKKIPAAHMQIWEAGRHELCRYWNLPRPDEAQLFGREALKTASDHVRELLEESVRKRLMSEVPLGAFLSGGVDSSAIVALARKLSVEPIHTFSVGVSEASIDESEKARTVAEHLGTVHHALRIETCTLDLLREINLQYDEPAADPAAVPTYCLSRFARRHITVALTGEGGDEVFAGYRHHAYSRKLDQWDQRLLGLGLVARGAQILARGVNSRLSKALWLAGLPAGKRVRGWTSAFTDKELSVLVRSGVTDESRAACFDSSIEEWETRNGPVDAVTRLLYFDAVSGLADQLLMKVDKMTMAASLEARCPLLDQELVEYAATLPTPYKLGPEGGKLVFRKAIRGLIPEEILNLPKQGFDMPLNDWYRGHLEPAVDSFILSDSSPLTEWLDRPAVDSLWRGNQKERSDRSQLQVWRLLNLAVWLELHWPRGLLEETGSSSELTRSLDQAISGDQFSAS